MLSRSGITFVLNTCHDLQLVEKDLQAEIQKENNLKEKLQMLMQKEVELKKANEQLAQAIKDARQDNELFAVYEQKKCESLRQRTQEMKETLTKMKAEFKDFENELMKKPYVIKLKELESQLHEYENKSKLSDLNKKLNEQLKLLTEQKEKLLSKLQGEKTLNDVDIEEHKKMLEKQMEEMEESHSKKMKMIQAEQEQITNAIKELEEYPFY